MRVLLTNVTLASRTGTEINIRDVARGLLRRGHQPVVYSPHLGEMAEEIRLATVPVVDDLTRLTTPPEVIHGHHHTTTMTALLRFRGVPALFFVHDWDAWTDEPLRFPRLQLYVPVDTTNRDRLEVEHGIPAERIRLLLNAVDLERFVPRPPLPSRPRRALVFSNYAAEDGHLGAIRDACTSAGLELSVIGSGTGTSAARPEDLLAGYDLVFAKARCALEALAVGCAVVLCDVHGFGEMVTATELPRLRALNFGRRALQRPVTAAAVAAEIARYDADDAAAVCAAIRAEAGLDRQLDRLLGFYDEAIRLGTETAIDEANEGEASARYLQRWLPRFAPPAHGSSTRGVVAVRWRDVVALQQALEGLRAGGTETEVAALRRRAELSEEAAAAERQRAGQAVAEATAATEALERRGTELAASRDELAAVHGELQWITTTVTWRLRCALLRLASVRRLHRWLMRRR